MVDGKTRASGRGARPTALGVGLATLLLLSSTAAFALDPSLDVSRYAHTAWRIRDGFPKGIVYAIVQSPDGYLWLGTEFGLFRFDAFAPCRGGLRPAGSSPAIRSPASSSSSGMSRSGSVVGDVLLVEVGGDLQLSASVAWLPRRRCSPAASASSCRWSRA